LDHSGELGGGGERTFLDVCFPMHNVLFVEFVFLPTDMRFVKNFTPLDIQAINYP